MAFPFLLASHLKVKTFKSQISFQNIHSIHIGEVFQSIEQKKPEN